MSNKRVRMVIEFAIDEEALQEHGLEVEDVLENIHVRQDDTCDGLDITTNIPGLDPTANFFIVGGDCVSLELIDDMQKAPRIANKVSENTVLHEDGHTFVLKEVSFPNQDIKDIEEAIQFGYVEDFACRISLAVPPSNSAEQFGRNRDGMYFEPDCFFIEATVGRDGADHNWERSLWFLFYTDVYGEDVYITDGFELSEAWDFVKKGYDALLSSERKAPLDSIISAATQSFENQMSDTIEHEEVER